jgi:hypothetical protein
LLILFTLRLLDEAGRCGPIAWNEVPSTLSARPDGVNPDDRPGASFQARRIWMS